MFRAGWTVLSLFLGVSIAAGEVNPPVVARKPAKRVEVAGCADCQFLARSPSRTPIRLVQDGPTFLAPVQTPKQLPPADDASPLPTPGESPELGEMLDRYLPDASADERGVWADELRSLPPGMARDLLAARSKLGEPRTLFTPPETGLVPPPLAEPHVAGPAATRSPSRAAVREDSPQRTISTLREVEAIHRHNIANAETVGFKRLRPLTFEATDHAGLDGFAVQRVEVQGTLESTGRAYDLAIDGTGFFQVRGGDSVALTRRGTFTLTPLGELALKVGDSMWSLYPTVSIPTEATEVTIRENGSVIGLLPGDNEVAIGQVELVRVSDASALESAGGGLLAVSELAGNVTTGLPGEIGFGKIQQARLELSNVELSAEVDAMQRIRQQIDALDLMGGSRLASPMADARRH